NVAGSAAERANGGVDAIGAGIDGANENHRGDAGRRVRVYVNGDFDGFFEGFDEVVRRDRAKQRGHVLDDDGLAAHFFELTGLLDEEFERVRGRDSVADGALGVRAAFEDGLGG